MALFSLIMNLLTPLCVCVVCSVIWNLQLKFVSSDCVFSTCRKSYEVTKTVAVVNG